MAFSYVRVVNKKKKGGVGKETIKTSAAVNKSE